MQCTVLSQVFPEKAQYPPEEEWENTWSEGMHDTLHTLSSSVINTYTCTCTCSVLTIANIICSVLAISNIQILYYMMRRWKPLIVELHNYNVCSSVHVFRAQCMGVSKAPTV